MTHIPDSVRMTTERNFYWFQLPSSMQHARSSVRPPICSLLESPVETQIESEPSRHLFWNVLEHTPHTRHAIKARKLKFPGYCVVGLVYSVVRRPSRGDPPKQPRRNQPCAWSSRSLRASGLLARRILSAQERGALAASLSAWPLDRLVCFLARRVLSTHQRGAPLILREGAEPRRRAP